MDKWVVNILKNNCLKVYFYHFFQFFIYPIVFLNPSKNRIMTVWVLMVLFTSCSSQKVPSFGCRIKYIEGKAYEYKSPGGKPILLKVGSKLSPQSIVKTDMNSIVDLEFSNKSVLRIQENSRITIKNFYNDLKQKQTNIYLELGKIFAKLEHYLEGYEYEIETDSVFINTEGGEFVVTVAEDKITKVAVREGSIYYSNKLEINELDALRRTNPEFAEKIKDIISDKKQLNANEKIETDSGSNRQYVKEISSIVALINRDLKKYKGDIIKTEEIIKNYSNDIEALANQNPTIKKSEISIDEWNNEFDMNKYLIVQRENLSDDNNKPEDKNKNEVKLNPESLNKEQKIEYISRIKKLPNKPILNLIEINTGFSSDLKNIYITSNINNSVYCINPITGLLNWSFNSPELQSMYSYAISYKSNILVGTMNWIFVLNVLGAIQSTKDISGGIKFWSSPLIYEKKLFIPCTNAIYIFEGKDFIQLENLPEVKDQLFIAAYANYLYIFEMGINNLKVYDLNKKNVVWTSYSLSNKILIPPCVNENYIFIADVKENMYRFNNQPIFNQPVILKMSTGVLTNLIAVGNFIYFIGVDGYFYRLNIKQYRSADKIFKVENNLDPNKFLTKKLLLHNNEIFFNSDSGKLFNYIIKSNTAQLLDIPDNSKPLLGTPVIIGNVMFFMDLDANIYKLYKEIKSSD